ncbi:DUF2088 domain-containing protein [Candidatus Sumerlaeota bacterium]|nr:DUF2088 domain-containing protein [Candidatus Sumerlaeota bacterium]
MLTEIPFGTKSIRADLPDRAVAIPNLALGSLPPVKDLDATVRDALDHPLGLPPISGLVKPGSRVTIAFDDPTVMSFGPVRGVVIRELLRRLESAGVDRRNVTLICANSLHRKFPHDELALLLGKDLVREFSEQLICHDAEDADQIVYLGKTSGGYDVEISRYVAESDLTVYINASHNRGFTGGWKSVCVGLSTYRSIRHHHTPDGMSMSIHNNRMHEMLNEMGALLESKIPGRIMKVDTLLANPFTVAKMFAGTVWETRREVMKDLEKLYPARRSLSAEKFEVVVYGVPAYSPYSVYASMNPMLTLISSGLGYLGGMIEAVGKPGCTVIMVTPCPDEWDRVHHAAYPDVWENVLTKTRDPYEIARDYSEKYATHEALIEKYRTGYSFHPIHGILATYPLKRLKHVGKVFVAGIENPAIARRLGFEPTATVEEAIRRAEEIHGADCRIAYVQQPTTQRQ